MGKYANFYNSKNGDRVYDAESFTEWLTPFFTTGVFNGDLQVLEKQNMIVKVTPGYVNIKGKTRYFDTEQELQIENSHATLKRIDSIVVRRNDVDRNINIMVIKGALSEKPVAPQPVRSVDTYDLVIGHINVAPSCVKITQKDITDTRMDSSICGWVASTVNEIKFNQITSQWLDYISNFKKTNEAAFLSWFETIKNKLGTDVAGNLLSLINNLESEVSKKANTKDVYTKIETDNLFKSKEITLSNTSSTKFKVSLQGVKETDTPILSVKTSHVSTLDEKQLILKEWNKVIEANTLTNEIEFTLTEPLARSIIVFVKGE